MSFLTNNEGKTLVKRNPDFYVIDQKLEML